jgi:hypothetical protein
MSFTGRRQKSEEKCSVISRRKQNGFEDFEIWEFEDEN